MNSIVRIEWKHGGNHVLLAGAFNNWKGVPMRNENGTWIEDLKLNQGVHQFKFIVDGMWRYDAGKPIVDDSYGNINNIVSVGKTENIINQQQQSGSKTQPTKAIETNKKQEPPKKTRTS